MVSAGGAGGAPESRAHELVGLACLSVGQVSRALAGALALGRVSHAYLFAVLNPGLPTPGDDGTDRATAAALSFARRLNCEAPTGDSACGTCLSCRLVADGNHPDVRIVSPDGLSVKIDQIRELKREMSLRPRRDGGFRVTIIEGAEKMTVEAQNSFLKLLEEPPERAVFILVCQNPSGLLPTVRSRCQMVRVRAADGGEGEIGDRFRSFVDTVRRAGTMSPLQVLEAAEALERGLRSEGAEAGADTQGEPRQRLEAALVVAAAWFRDVLVLKSTGDIALACAGAGAACGNGGPWAGPQAGSGDKGSGAGGGAVSVEDGNPARDGGTQAGRGTAPDRATQADRGTLAGRAAELARDAAAHSVDELIRMIDLIEEARRQVRRNANMRLALEAMLFALKKCRLQACPHAGRTHE